MPSLLWDLPYGTAYSQDATGCNPERLSLDFENMIFTLGIEESY